MKNKAGRPKGSPNKSLSKDRLLQESIDTNIKASKIIMGLALQGQITAAQFEKIQPILKKMSKILDAKATKGLYTMPKDDFSMFEYIKSLKNDNQ